MTTASGVGIAIPTEDRVYKAARVVLQHWLNVAPKTYREVFQNGSVGCAKVPIDLGALRELGIVDVAGGTIRARMCICPFDDLFLICDHPR
jgi:hypothetical protein